MQTDNLPASEGQSKTYGPGKALVQSSIENGQEDVQVRKKGSQDRGNGDAIDGNSKSRTRYNSTKYRTIKAVPNSSIVKRVQRLYTEGAAQSSAQKYPKTTLDRQSCNPASKISLSFSSNPILVDLHPTLPQGQPQSKPNPKAYNKNHPPYSTKEQMYEQNMHLKSLINELKEELSRQKIQTQLQKKKNKRYTNVLNREFKKELYYQGKLAQAGEKACEEEVEKIAKLYNNSDESENDSPEKQSGPYSDVIPFGDRKQYQNNYKQYKIMLKTQQISPERSPSPTNIRSSEYMIAGIKQKYEELKNEHQRVLRELEKYKNVDPVQKLQELSIYCMALEENNRKLADGLSSCKFKLAAYENGKQQNQMYQSALTIELNGKIATLKSKNGALRQQNKRVKEQNKEHGKLIRYLETIIIQKQNKQRRSSKAIKKVNAILEHLEEELNREKEENKQLKQVYIEEMQKLSMKNHEEIQEQRQAFEETLMEKNMEIRKLEKEMGYMATIIQNWKLGEEKQTIVSNADNTARRRKESSVTGKEIGQKLVFEDKGPDTLGPLSTISEKKELEKQYHSKVNQIGSSNRKPSTQNESTTKAQDKEKKAKGLVQKKRKTSAVKRSENAKKQRKVNLEQVIDLPEYIRYRLIGLNLSIDQACKYFDYRPPAEERKDRTESEEEDSVDHEEAKELEKWKKMYINQAELTSTLIQEPFKLRPEDAVLLARYIIQDQQFYQNGDTTNAFVYSDFQNEIERTLTKSIMKAFIQTHSTNLLHPTGEGSLFHTCQKQWAKIIEKSGVRINTPLISIAPGGTVTKERWNQLLGSIGMEIGENVKEWCIGRMLLESEGLGKLRYRAVVPEGL